MRTIINLILIVVIAIVGYNFFFGDQSEKTESQEIVQQVKDLGRSIGDLMKSEKEKFDEGKYDGVFDRMRTIFDKVKSQLNSADSSGQEELQGLEKDLNELENKIRDAEDSTVSDQTQAEWQAEIEELLRKAERMLDEQ